jgi:hypothetical protein
MLPQQAVFLASILSFLCVSVHQRCIEGMPVYFKSWSTLLTPSDKHLKTLAWIDAKLLHALVNYVSHSLKQAERHLHGLIPNRCTHARHCMLYLLALDRNAQA